MPFDVDGRALLDELEHQLVEPKGAGRRNIFKHTPIDGIDAHTDKLREFRLLAEVHEALALDPENTIVQDLVAVGGADREDRARGNMVRKKPREIEVTQHVRVDDQKVVREIADQSKRSNRPQIPSARHFRNRPE
jgi:hypothetical protein